MSKMEGGRGQGHFLTMSKRKTLCFLMASLRETLDEVLLRMGRTWPTLSQVHLSSCLSSPVWTCKAICTWLYLRSMMTKTVVTLSWPPWGKVTYGNLRWTSLYMAKTVVSLCWPGDWWLSPEVGQAGWTLTLQEDWGWWSGESRRLAPVAEWPPAGLGWSGRPWPGAAGTSLWLAPAHPQHSCSQTLE